MVTLQHINLCFGGCTLWSFGELNCSGMICYSLELTVPLPHTDSPVGTYPLCVGLHSCIRNPPSALWWVPQWGALWSGSRGDGSGRLCLSAGGQAPVKVALHRTPSPGTMGPRVVTASLSAAWVVPLPYFTVCFQ